MTMSSSPLLEAPQHSSQPVGSRCGHVHRGRHLPRIQLHEVGSQPSEVVDERGKHADVSPLQPQIASQMYVRPDQAQGLSTTVPCLPDAPEVVVDGASEPLLASATLPCDPSEHNLATEEACLKALHASDLSSSQLLEALTSASCNLERPTSVVPHATSALQRVAAAGAIKDAGTIVSLYTLCSPLHRFATAVDSSDATELEDALGQAVQSYFAASFRNAAPVPARQTPEPGASKSPSAAPSCTRDAAAVLSAMVNFPDGCSSDDMLSASTCTEGHTLTRRALSKVSHEAMASVTHVLTRCMRERVLSSAADLASVMVALAHARHCPSKDFFRGLDTVLQGRPHQRPAVNIASYSDAGETRPKQQCADLSALAAIVTSCTALGVPCTAAVHLVCRCLVRDAGAAAAGKLETPPSQKTASTVGDAGPCGSASASHSVRTESAGAACSGRIAPSHATAAEASATQRNDSILRQGSMSLGMAVDLLHAIAAQAATHRAAVDPLAVECLFGVIADHTHVLCAHHRFLVWQAHDVLNEAAAASQSHRGLFCEHTAAVAATSGRSRQSAARLAPCGARPWRRRSACMRRLHRSYPAQQLAARTALSDASSDDSTDDFAFDLDVAPAAEPQRRAVPRAEAAPSAGFSALHADLSDVMDHVTACADGAFRTVHVPLPSRLATRPTPTAPAGGGQDDTAHPAPAAPCVAAAPAPESTLHETIELVFRRASDAALAASCKAAWGPKTEPLLLAVHASRRDPRSKATFDEAKSASSCTAESSAAPASSARCGAPHDHATPVGRSDALPPEAASATQAAAATAGSADSVGDTGLWRIALVPCSREQMSHNVLRLPGKHGAGDRICSRVLDGATTLHCWRLRRAGFRVVTVPFWKWERFGHNVHVKAKWMRDALVDVCMQR